MKKIFLFLGCCLLGWGSISLMAQQGNVAAGGQAVGAGGSVSYSIGQVNYLSASGTGGSLNQGLQQPDGARSICGTLTYDNAAGTFLNNCQVFLKQGAALIATTSSDASGYFQFNNPETGEYNLDAASTKPWGSVNATDALLVLKHFVGMDPLAGLRLAAADVDATTYINAADALSVMKRFVGLQTSFIPGDWVFEHPMVSFSGSDNVTADFKGLCYGDVDGSYIPPYLKPEPTLFLEQNGVQTIDNLIVSVPVRLKQSLNCAAVSLVMNFPSSEMEILGVEAAYDAQNLMYNVIGNQVRIGWYTLHPVVLNQNEVLMTLKVRLTNIHTQADLNFAIDAESNVADFEGNVLAEKTLLIPSLVGTSQGFTLNQNIPNPFSSNTRISYVLPDEGYVKLELLNVVGQELSVLIDGQQDAGSHVFELSANDLSNGVYFYRMTVITGEQQFSQTKRMVISH